MNIYLYYLLDENEKVRYVGITSRVKQRINQHKNSKPKHTFELIEHFNNPEDAGLAEQNHIMRHDTFDNGWNKSIGGETVLTGKDHPSYIHGMSKTPKEYQKQWYQENKDKMKEINKQYYQENKEKILENEKQYRLENKERQKQYYKQYYEKNKERILEHNKQYRLAKKNT